MRLRVAGAAILAALALTACPETRSSTSPQESLRTAQRSLDTRNSGDIDFALRASAEGTGPVGFEIEGPYSFERNRELAVLDLTYRILLGDESEEWRMVSTGEEAWLVAEDEVTAITDDQAAPLRLAENARSAAVPAVNIGGWISNPTATRERGVVTIFGEARASALVQDMQTVAAQVTGSGAVTKLDAKSAEQIDDAAENSEMTVVLRDDELRSVEAWVDFGGDVPTSVREALGSYAGARLELSLDIEDVETPLTVEEPE